MKTGVASVKDSIDSEISQVSGRAPHWLIFEDKKLVKSIKNPFQFGGGGAGFGVAKMLKQEKVELVIAGQFGPNMQKALEDYGIKTKIKQDITVKEVIEKINN